MSYITARKARLQKQLTNVQARLDLYYAAILDMDVTGAKSYRFDSGEGSQSTVRRSFDEIQNLIRELEATEAHLVNELSCMGLISIAVRRR